MSLHLAILKATKNPLVIRIGETIFQLFKPSISVSMQYIAPRAVQDHRRIFDAFRSGDPAQLRAAVVKSYDGWKESLYRHGVAAGSNRMLKKPFSPRLLKKVQMQGGERKAE